MGDERRAGMVMHGRGCMGSIHMEIRLLSLPPPSHPNSPFSLVHDHLKQRAHASMNARARRGMKPTRSRCTLDARVAAPRNVPAVYFIPLCDVPNSFPSRRSRRKKHGYPKLGVPLHSSLEEDSRQNYPANDPAARVPVVTFLQEASLKRETTLGRDRTP